MKFFLMIFDRQAREIVELREYGWGDGARALRDRFARELEERHHPEIEVVVLSASSLEALKHTHRRYFLGDTKRLASAAS